MYSYLENLTYVTISEVAIKLEVCSSKSSLLQSEFSMYKKMGAVVTTPGAHRRPKSKGQRPPVSSSAVRLLYFALESCVRSIHPVWFITDTL